MEVEDFASQLERRLNDKTEESPTYRKASGILTSLMTASQKIPNFKILYANNTKTIALYLTAGVFKLLKRNVDGEQQHQHNLDAYLLLLSFTLPETSPDALIQSGLINQLRDSMLKIVARKDNTPFITRLATSILSHALAPTIATADFRCGQNKNMLLDLFQKAVASPRSNALSRECSKLIVHIINVNPSASSVIAQQSKNHLFSSLDEKKQLYLSNVKQVMIELPVRFLNDICHRVASNLSDIDAADPNQENYLAQTYFFLEKMTSKLLSSTLQDLIMILIGAVPAGTQPQRVQLSYLQLLYEAILALTQSNEHAANKLLSPVISILTQQLLISPKICKFAGNLLVFILNNCVRPSLWRHHQDQLSLEMINLQESGRNFTKIICHLQSLLSSRFTNTKLTATILSEFFSKLQGDAWQDCIQLIQRIVDYRSELPQKCFKKIFQSIIVAFGFQSIFSIFPISLNGDISNESFQQNNNLWLLSILQKSERSQSMTVFYKFIFPLINKSRQYYQNQTLSKHRRQGYLLIENMMWRCIKVCSRIADANINYQQVFNIVDLQIRRSNNDNTLQELAIALQLLSNILAPLKYKSTAAEQLIKTLAGILQISNGNAKSILTAIKGLSKLAPKQYVKRVFDKNIQKLIGLSQAKSLNKEQQKNLKNLQILMAVNSSIDLTDPSVTTQFRLSRQELLLRLVTSLINSNGTFQKKGYKYLNQTLCAAPKSLYLQVLELFESSIKIDNGAKYHRLNALGRIWTWLRNGDLQQNLEKIIGFIKSHLPQVLLSLRDHNKGARNEGIRIMGEFTQAMKQMDLVQSFVQSVCAGLIGQRSQMKLATLTGLGVIISKGYCTQQIFKEVLEIVLLLLKQKRQELYKGVVQFCRRGVISLSIDQQKLYLPAVLQNLFEEDEQGKMQHRSILRHFLIKLTKKHGRQHIQQMIPQPHRKMLAHTLKMQNRQKRKKRQQNLARRQMYEKQKEKEQAQLSSESEQENEGQQGYKHDNQMQVQDEPLEDLDNTNNLLLKYDLQKEQFHFEKQQQKKIQAAKRIEKNQDQITFDDKGIMIIEDRKRQRVNDQQEQEQQKSAVQKDTLNFKKKPKTEVHQVKQSGDTFKSARAGGDVKLKDKPQPYAFIQFSSKALNKRFKKRAQHVFESLFEKKEGGLKGLKSRITSGH